MKTETFAASASTNYELREEGGLGTRQVVKIQGDQLNLTRKDGFGAWELDGLNAETEELETTEVNNVASGIDELEIVGVRPKFSFKGQQLITADLQLNEIPELQQDPRQFNLAMNQLLTELNQNGFTIYENPDATLISTFGSVAVGTESGIVYNLNFGKSIDGDESEIEIGAANPKDTVETDDSTTEDVESGGEESTQPADENETSGQDGKSDSKNRFLMIRIGFDETLLGDRPGQTNTTGRTRGPRRVHATGQKDGRGRRDFR